MPRKRSAKKKGLSPQQKRELDVQIGFIEGVLRRDPQFLEALQLLGDCYTKRGRHEDGLRVDERLSQLDPKNPLTFYNLACSCSLTGRVDKALSALENALALGYRDFAWMARDPDLKPLRKDPRYRALRERIRQMDIELFQ